MAAHRPEAAERAREAQLDRRVVFVRPVERGAQVVDLTLELVQDLTLVVARAQAPIAAVGELEEVRGMAPAQLLRLPARLEPLERVLTDRREHPQPPRAVAWVDEALLHQ